MTDDAPYLPPAWGAAPKFAWTLEALKDGVLASTHNVHDKEWYLVGRHGDMCDIVLEHASISRLHAALQHKDDGSIYAYDLGSTHGTFVNKRRIPAREYVRLHAGDFLVFGQSTRKYFVTGGPDDLDERRDRALQTKIAAAAAAGSEALEVKRRAKEAEQATKMRAQTQLDELIALIDSTGRPADAEGGATWGEADDAFDSDEEAANMTRALARYRGTDNRVHYKDLVMTDEELKKAMRRHVRRRQREWAANLRAHYSDDDDDEFYDRTEHARRRRARHAADEHADAPEKAHTEASLTADLRNVLLLKRSVQRRIEAARSAAKSGAAAQVDALDAYLSELSSAETHDASAAFREELAELDKKQANVERLLRIVNPSFRISEFLQRTASNLDRVERFKFGENVGAHAQPEAAAEPAPSRESAPARAASSSTAPEAAETAAEAPRAAPPSAPPPPSSIAAALDLVTGLNMMKKPPPSSSSSAAAEAAASQPSALGKRAASAADDVDARPPPPPPPPPPAVRAATALPHAKAPAAPPSKPADQFDSDDADSTWMPPEGQSGDGRTSLNARLGY